MPTSPRSNPASFSRVTDDLQAERAKLMSFEMVPKLLVERFGEPSPSDGFKVSGEFAFADEQGNVFVIYEWKMTNLYEGTLSPEEFWDLDEIVPLQVGGPPRARKALNEFLSWLDQALVDGLQTDQDWLASLSSEQTFSVEDQDRLLHLAQNGGDKTQICALEAIGRIGEPVATPKLLDTLLQLLHLRQPTRPAAFGALFAFANLSHTSWVQSRVLEELNSRWVDTRRNALSALGVLGTGVWSDAVLDRFGELLTEEPTTENALLCMNWILAVRRTAPPPRPDIVSGIALHLRSPSARIRKCAADAVVTQGKAAAVFDVLTPLFRMLGEADRGTRVSSEMSFEKLGELVAIPGLLSHLCQSVPPEDFQVKAGALRVARNIAKLTGEAEAGRSLVRLIKNSSPRKK